MSFIVDTNILSDLRLGAAGNPGVQAWAQTVSDEDLAISVITVKELEYGVLRRARRDTAQGMIFRAWLDHVIFPASRDACCRSIGKSLSERQP